MILSLVLFVSHAVAADVGAFPTSTWYETISDADGRTIWFQVHYPAVSADYGADAEPSGGPFPLIGLMHGYLGQAWMYESVADAFASMGFVVVNLDTETGPWMDPYALANDAQAALEWVETRSAERDHWLHGMAADAPWTVMGHSMGGIAMAALVDQSARVDLAIGFAPYRDDDYLWDAYASFGGAALIIAGDEDDTSTPEVVSGWLEDMDAPSRGLLAMVQGAGHQAVTDLSFEAAGLSESAQLAANIELAAAFLRAQRFGEEQAYDKLVCAPPTALAQLTARGTAPATAAVAIDDARVRLSLVGAEGDEAVIYAGAEPGRGITPDGAVGLADPVEIGRVALPAGAACAELSLPAGLRGSAWLQVVHRRAETRAFGRVIDAYGADFVGPDADSADADPPDAAAASFGCTHLAPGGRGLLALLSLGLFRRRSA